MNLQTRLASACAIIASIMVIPAGGCGRIIKSEGSNPYEFAPPPTVATSTGPRAASAPGRTVVVIGEFANPPSASVPWSDIGRGMSDALARTLFNDSRADVWLRPELSRQVESILRGSAARRDEDLAKVRAANPDVDFVLTGRVTDFHHSTDLPAGMSNNSFFGKKPQAFVALQLDLVDLATRRVIGISHLYGTAAADDKPAAAQYKGLRFNSYLFWSTPLGKASRDTIRASVEQLDLLLPGPVNDIRVVMQADRRTLALDAGRDRGLIEGERWYLLQIVDANTRPQPLLDPDTRLPLQVRIEEVEKSAATAWLIGRAPVNVSWRDVVLSRQLPEPRTAEAPAKPTPPEPAQSPKPLPKTTARTDEYVVPK